MTSGAPGDADDNSNAGSTLSMQEIWKTSQHLSVGDVVILNWEYVFEIKAISLDESTIDYLGKLPFGDDKWRVLRVESARMGAVGLLIPGDDSRIGIVDISPYDETILAAQTADTLLYHDVTGEDTYDSYVDKRDSGVEFPDEVTVVGQCICGGDVATVEEKAICEECGRWVPVEVWESLSEGDSPGSDSEDETVSDNTSLDGPESGDRSLGDFM